MSLFGNKSFCCSVYRFKYWPKHSHKDEQLILFMFTQQKGMAGGDEVMRLVYCCIYRNMFWGKTSVKNKLVELGFAFTSRPLEASRESFPY